MASLFKYFRVHQIFGANTDVGKTLLTTGLVRASIARGTPTHYLKPVSTGPLENADDRYVRTYGGPSHLLKTTCLYRFDEPISPHLASRQIPTGNIPSDSNFVRSIANHLRQSATGQQMQHGYVETAGGVHSPTPNGTSQAESYRPLFLPTILIGDPKLGGISSTISAYEALRLRGYIIDAVVMFKDDYYRNWEYLSEYFERNGIQLTSLEPPPMRLDDSDANYQLTSTYYESIVPQDKTGPLFALLDLLDRRHRDRLNELVSMPKRALDTLWWPFVQHGLVNEQDVTVIDSAHGDFFSVHDATSFDQLHQEFDGSASWWTQTLGHAQSALTLAAAEASGRYGHVMFPQAVHLPALRLAEWLVQDGPGKGWASRVFYSDDGSTGMEVALKMALRYFTTTNQTEEKPAELGVLGLKGSYHGDTIGAMDACEQGVYTCEWHKPKGIWLDPPTIGIKSGQVHLTLPSSLTAIASGIEDMTQMPSLQWAYDVTGRLSTPLADIYRKHIADVYHSSKQAPHCRIAALVIEPLVMGAGGMLFVDPLFQRLLVDVLRDLAKQDGIALPIIFDEVFVGLYRMGFQTATSILGTFPDISVNAKILTGGLVPLAVTLASERIFRAFLSSAKADALLHGHSYTAHPLGCQVAIETLKQIEMLKNADNWSASREEWTKESSERRKTAHVWSFWSPGFVDAISNVDPVEEVMAMGTVLAIRLGDSFAGYHSNFANILFARMNIRENDTAPSPAPGGAPFGVHFRTLGNVAYFMTSLNTSPKILRSMEQKILAVLNKKLD